MICGYVGREAMVRITPNEVLKSLRIAIDPGPDNHPAYGYLGPHGADQIIQALQDHGYTITNTRASAQAV